MYITENGISSMARKLGYSKRSGLACLDYQSPEGIPEDSYSWHRGVIASRGDLPGAIAPLR